MSTTANGKESNQILVLKMTVFLKVWVGSGFIIEFRQICWERAFQLTLAIWVLLKYTTTASCLFFTEVFQQILRKKLASILIVNIFPLQLMIRLNMFYQSGIQTQKGKCILINLKQGMQVLSCVFS